MAILRDLDLATLSETPVVPGGFSCSILIHLFTNSDAGPKRLDIRGESLELR